MKEKSAIQNWKEIFPLKNLNQFRKIWFDEDNLELREHFKNLIATCDELAIDNNLINIINSMNDIQLLELKKKITQERNRSERRKENSK